MIGTPEAARIIGIDPDTVRQRAGKLKIGTKIHNRALAFTDDEVDMLINYKDRRKKENR